MTGGVKAAGAGGGFPGASTALESPFTVTTTDWGPHVVRHSCRSLILWMVLSGTSFTSRKAFLGFSLTPTPDPLYVQVCVGSPFYVM